MANFVAVLKKGMDVTPGGPDESAVPPGARLGEALALEQRVALLVETTCFTLFNYVAQVRAWCWPRASAWAHHGVPRMRAASTRPRAHACARSLTPPRLLLHASALACTPARRACLSGTS